jgi:hypothetical protein
MSNEGEVGDFLEETSREKLKLTLLNPTTHFNTVLGPRRRPSPSSEGDRDQQWSNLGGVAISPSFFPFLFLFLLFLTTRSDGSESPPPPLSFPNFRFTSHPSDLVLYGGDLLEALGDLSLHRPLSLLSARICHSSGRRDHRRQWMSGGHRIWGLLPVRPSIDPTFGFDFLKLFLKSPYHTRITWHLLPWQTRFDSVVYLAGIMAPNLLLFRTLIVVVALVLFWTVVKLCVDWCYCYCTVCVCVCCCLVVVVVVVFVVVVVVVVMLFYFAALLVGSFAVTYVTFSALYVGFCIPFCRVM